MAEEDTGRRIEEGYGNRPLSMDEKKLQEEDINNQHPTADSHVESIEKEEGVSQKDEQPLIKSSPKSKRIATLDVFRGLTVVVCNALCMSSF